MMATVFEDIRTNIDFLRQFLCPRFFTARLIKFTEKEGVLSVIRDLSSALAAETDINGFARQDFYETLAMRLGYKVEDPVRKRMLNILLDFLEECSLISHKGNGDYIYNPDGGKMPAISEQEMEILKRLLRGQVMFFNRCIDYAGEFLRGGDYLYTFEKGMEDIWDNFLENYEFSVARTMLLEAMALNNVQDCKILDLCYGTGSGLKEICRDFPDASVFAVDFTDVMRDMAITKIGSDIAKVRWFDKDVWKGFGHPLPFDDTTFDMVFFSCGDPYIPNHLREYVYKDIFRILKLGGILGVVAWGYPDKERNHIQNKWIRNGIYIHDFAESVCKGWHGFRGIDDTTNMAREIGFVQGNVVSKNFYMLDSAVWMFKRP